ncbi:MAG TPA: DUF4417 domain-containing protein [Acidimicrobiales bacterium]|nr:DUF4417 domain-containing protein [Acidimicrobiales bacterium]
MRIPVATIAPAAGCDCASCALYVGNPGAAEPICSGCNTDCDYCGCSRAGAQVAAPCGQCPIRCGSRTDIRAWMADVGGTLAFDDLALATELPPGLPRFVPQVDGHDVGSFDAGLSWPAYGVGLRRVFSPDTHRMYPKFAGVRAGEALGLAAGQLAVLVGYGEDPLVEAFWTNRRALIPEVAAQRWDLVLAPNFSMYGNQPRAEHLLSFRRNLAIAVEMAEAGIAAVPNVYWFRLEDLDRYLAWLADAPPAAIAMNLQTFRTAGDWEEMALPGLTYLAMSMPADVAVIVTGSSRAERIAALLELFGSRLHLVSQNPQAYARHGAQMTAAGRVETQADTRDLFAANVRFYDALVRGGA